MRRSGLAVTLVKVSGAALAVRLGNDLETRNSAQ